MKTTATTREKAVAAIAKYCETRGRKIVDQDPQLEGIDLVAHDTETGELAFVSVAVVEGTAGGFPDPEAPRELLEQSAAEWLARNGDGDFTEVAVRFDAASLKVIAADRAFLRVHANWLA